MAGGVLHVRLCVMTLPRSFLLAFGLVALLGALLATGRIAGEGGWQSAIGITLTVTGVLGLLNTVFFTRLKASLAKMADQSESKE